MYKENHIYKFSIFKKYPNLIQGISTRFYGTVKENGQIQEENLSHFVTDLGIDRKQLILVDQLHAGTIITVNSVKDDVRKDVDGIITTKKNLFMGIRTADCVPILFYDVEKEIAGIVHAGYKGILNDIIHHILLEFKKLGSNLSDITVGIGPGIGNECYSASSKRIELFKQKFPDTVSYQYKDGTYFLNLEQTAFSILTSTGIHRDNIEKASLCTKCNNTSFYSYRGDSKETFGLCMSIIGMA